MSAVSRYANGNARRKVRAWLKSQGLPCAICGRAIDYSLPSGDPMSFEVDEIVPVSKGGSPIDKANVQPAHRICNQRRGNKDLPRTRRRMPMTARDVPRDHTSGKGRAPSVPSASTRDIEAAIADVYGPRPCDLKTEDARRF